MQLKYKSLQVELLLSNVFRFQSHKFGISNTRKHLPYTEVLEMAASTMLVNLKRKENNPVHFFISLYFFSIISSFLSFSIPVLSLYTKHDNPAILLLCQKKRSYSTWLQTIVSYRLTWIWLIKILYKEITNISKIGVLKPVLSFK